MSERIFINEKKIFSECIRNIFASTVNERWQLTLFAVDVAAPRGYAADFARVGYNLSNSWGKKRHATETLVSMLLVLKIIVIYLY
jgi:hypothetical protein